MMAVLPLDNLSGDPEQEFFSDGITAEMIVQLGRMAPKQLGVIARTSVMRYKNTEKSIAEIARELNVDYVLEGSVRRVSDKVRVTAQLIHANDQTQLWAESYDREMSNILELQSEVVRAIAGEIEINLAPQELSRLLATRTVAPPATSGWWTTRKRPPRTSETRFTKAGSSEMLSTVPPGGSSTVERQSSGAPVA